MVTYVENSVNHITHGCEILNLANGENFNLEMIPCQAFFIKEDVETNCKLEDELLVEAQNILLG